MRNSDLHGAWEYHDRTKHSVQSLRANPHFLDWDIQPRPYKIYPQLEPIPLPRDWPAAAMPALEAIASPGTATDEVIRPTLATLARLLLLASGITRKTVYANGREMHFRAAACTGALYHIDLYLVCGALADLDAGVYHFGPHDFALRRLRAGDYRAAIVAATGNEPALAAAPAILVCTSTFWRNSWKYQERAYRHCFWDSGTILANLLAAAAAARVPVRMVLGFVDHVIATLLALDGEREVPLVLVAMGREPSARPGMESPRIPPLSLETDPLSTREVDYPAIRAAHAASSLTSPEEARAWRGLPPIPVPPAPSGPTFPLDAGTALPAETIDAVIRRRGSSREFAHAPISVAQLSTLLRHATAGIPADFLDSPGAYLSDLYLIVNAVDGLAAGTYFYHRPTQALELLRAGNFRREAGFLGLGQELPADASVNFYLLANLRPLLERFGNRGYRAAQLEAAITGGKLYLGAYALHLGATGLTFFDDAVTEFFSPHAAGKSVMFLTAVGQSRKRRERV